MSRSEDLFGRIQSDGPAAIDELIANRTSEELFLDFKRSSDNGAGLRLSDTDLKNLAKSISGFGNSSGGLLIWGVDCSPDAGGADIARAKVPLVDAARFRAWLENAVSGRTTPPHQGVEHHTVLCGDGAGGFVATHIPQSNHAPHQTVGNQQYYIRAGSSFVAAPHAVLAGMFGRRPLPNAYHNYAIPPAQWADGRIVLNLGFMMHNEGPGIAEDLFATMDVKSLYGSNCRLKIEGVDTTDWRYNWSFGRYLSIISKGGLKLPPGGFVQPFIIACSFAPPFDRPLLIDGYAGASAGPRHPIRMERDPADAAAAFEEFRVEVAAGELPTAKGTAYTARIMGMPDDH